MGNGSGGEIEDKGAWVERLLEEIEGVSELEKTLTEWQQEVHWVAVEHGWWEGRRGVPELLCLVHSEVSEALEAYRRGDFELFGEELADIVIRVMDMAEWLQIDLGVEVAAKNEKNKGRGWRHGGKVA